MEKKDEVKVADALDLMEAVEGGDVKVGEINLEELDQSIVAYENGENRSGRSKNSGMANYRRTLNSYLVFKAQKGDTEVEGGAIVRLFADKVLGCKNYHKSYNYLLSCVTKGQYPAEWEWVKDGVNGQNGFKLKAKAEAEVASEV